MLWHWPGIISPAMPSNTVTADATSWQLEHPHFIGGQLHIRTVSSRVCSTWYTSCTASGPQLILFPVGIQSSRQHKVCMPLCSIAFTLGLLFKWKRESEKKSAQVGDMVSSCDIGLTQKPGFSSYCFGFVMLCLVLATTVYLDSGPFFQDPLFVGIKEM